MREPLLEREQVPEWRKIRDSLAEAGLPDSELTRFKNGGIQRIYRFPNGYGASVVQGPYSYGTEEGKWELAVTLYYGEGLDQFSLTYKTWITKDVLGHLSEAEVDIVLNDIEDLPKFVGDPLEERREMEEKHRQLMDDFKQREKENEPRSLSDL